MCAALDAVKVEDLEKAKQGVKDEFGGPYFAATSMGGSPFWCLWKSPRAGGPAKAATFSRPYYPTFRLRNETSGILKEEKRMRQRAGAPRWRS